MKHNPHVVSHLSVLFLALAVSAWIAPAWSQAPQEEIVLRYDFSKGSEGWLPGFSDYTLETGDLQLLAEIRPLPEEIDSTRKGYYLQGMNRSDDLFMFLKKPLGWMEGVRPNQTYNISIDIEFASNAPSGCFGIGGPPGEAVHLKAGITPFEPVAILARGSEVSLSADKGQQGTGGRDAGVVGNIANGRPCEEAGSPYVFMHKLYHHPHLVTTDLRGVLWVLIGTDSGFEGLTGIYYYSILITLRPVS